MDMTPETKRLNVFISYAHEDELFLQQLKSHLSLLQNQEIITIWHDRDISAGTEWEEEISVHMEMAHIILLLISADFLASNYCYSIEMKRALEKHEEGKVCLIPIILRPVDWEGEPSLKKLQALPTNAMPVTTWSLPPTYDDAYYDIAIGIRQVAMRLLSLQEPMQETLSPEVKVSVKQQMQKDQETWRKDGDWHYCVGHYERALHAYQQAIALASHDTLACCGRGYTLLALGQYDQALAAYDRAIQLDPDFAYAYNGKGEALLALTRYNDALAAYDQALQLDPSLLDNFGRTRRAYDSNYHFYRKNSLQTNNYAIPAPWQIGLPTSHSTVVFILGSPGSDKTTAIQELSRAGHFHLIREYEILSEMFQCDVDQRRFHPVQPSGFDILSHTTVALFWGEGEGYTCDEAQKKS